MNVNCFACKFKAVARVHQMHWVAAGLVMSDDPFAIFFVQRNKLTVNPLFYLIRYQTKNFSLIYLMMLFPLFYFFYNPLCASVE